MASVHKAPPVAPIPATAAPVARWQWRPLPEEPDAHPEDACDAGDNGVLAYLAARARGKSHKHNGKHCDDWYVVSTAQEWIIVCVADGAGSARLARVGARAACEAAHHALSKHLPSLDPAAQAWQQQAQDAMLHALDAAYEAVIRACEARQSSRWREILGRDPVLQDLRSTLLLAAVRSLGAERWRYVATQVGDGRIVAISDIEGCWTPRPIAERIGGEFSGETDFLVDAKRRRGFAPAIECGDVIAPMAFCVMTDGVDDIYGAGSERTYVSLLGELLLNQVLTVRPSSPDLPAMPGTAHHQLAASIDQCRQPNDQRLLERPETIRLYDIDCVAQHIIKKPVSAWSQDDFCSFPAWCRTSRPITDDQQPERRLLAWLDGKDVRGEFDDRTLVIVHPKDGIPVRHGMPS